MKSRALLQLSQNSGRSCETSSKSCQTSSTLTRVPHRDSLTLKNHARRLCWCSCTSTHIVRLPQSLHNSTKSGKPSTETIADFPNFHWTFLLNQKKTTSQKISSHLTRLSVNCMRIQPISWKLILVSSRKVDLFLRFSGQGNNYDFDPRWLKSIRSDRFMFLNVGSARQTCFLRGWPKRYHIWSCLKCNKNHSTNNSFCLFDT